MDDFLAGDDSAEQQQAGGAPVVVNPTTASDDLMFMGDENPYDASATTDGADKTESQPAQATDGQSGDLFASIDGGADADPLMMGGTDANGGDELKDEQQSEQKEKSEDEPTFLSVWQEERKLELEKRRTTEKEAQKESIEKAQASSRSFRANAR